MDGTVLMDTTATPTPASFFESDSTETSCTTEIPWPAEWLEKKLRALQGLSRLPANWDSYGATAVDVNAIEYAGQMLTVIARITREEPAVGASPSGSALLTWTTDSGNTVFELEFFGDGEINYARTRLNDPKGDKEGRTKNLGVFVELIPH